MTTKKFLIESVSSVQKENMLADQIMCELSGSAFDLTLMLSSAMVSQPRIAKIVLAALALMPQLEKSIKLGNSEMQTLYEKYEELDGEEEDNDTKLTN